MYRVFMQIQIIIDQDKMFEASKHLKNQVTFCRQGRRYGTFIPSDLYTGSVFINKEECFSELKY